jgi:phosphoglycolate phosphatase
MEIKYAVLFDMDGTLLQTEQLATPAFKRTFEDLRERKLWDGPTPSDDQLSNVLGMTITQLWDTLLPGAENHIKETANEWMLQHEKKLLQEGACDLYPGVREQLKLLYDKGIALFVVSNGLEEYIEAVCTQFDLHPLFTDLYSAGRFRTTSKHDLVAKLLAAYKIGQAVMVGDRHSDIEAGKKNGLFTIACDFGYAKPGELEGADITIRQFSELTAHLPFPIIHLT